MARDLALCGRAKRSAMRARVLSGLAVVLLAATTTGIGAASAASTVEVSPATGLADEQVVTVSFRDFTPFTNFGWCQTLADDPDPGSCTAFGNGRADAQGDFTGAIRVARFQAAPWLGEVVDCAVPVQRCVVAWGALTFDPLTRVLGMVPIEFATPPPPAERGTITVEPANAPAGGEVLVTAAGLRPDSLHRVYQCATDADVPTFCSAHRPAEELAIRSDAAGGLETTWTVEEVITDHLGNTTQCAVAGACVVAVAELVDFRGTVIAAPIRVTGLPAMAPLGDWYLREDGIDSLQLWVTLSSPSEDVVTVDWETVTPTALPPFLEPAEPGVDYVAASGTLTFPPGSTEQEVVVLPLDDDVAELGEAFAVRLSGAVGARLAAPEVDVLVHIFDDELEPVAVPGAAAVVEGDAGESTLEVPLRLTHPSVRPITVQWVTVEVGGLPVAEATAGVDYTPSSGVLTFEPLQVLAVARIPVAPDLVAEADELIVVAFHSPTNTRLGGFWGLGFGGIADDD
jgi:hypothetical protein